MTEQLNDEQYDVQNLPRDPVPNSADLQQSILQATSTMPQLVLEKKLEKKLQQDDSGQAHPKLKLLHRTRQWLFPVPAWYSLSAPGPMIAATVAIAVLISLLVPFSPSQLNSSPTYISSGHEVQDTAVLHGPLADEDERIWQELMLMQDELAFNAFADAEFSEL